MKKKGIIVQARTGSTRLPKKMILPVFEGRSMLELILKRLKDNFDGLDLVLATTESKGDDQLAEIASELGIKVFRGSEDNVLDRFVKAAEENQIDTIVRVCADNPFLSTTLLSLLLESYSDQDYFSFKYQNGKPTILGHMGLFAEITTLDTLKKVADQTSEKLYQEHVTNYIYTHPEMFTVELIDLPDEIKGFDGIRLTVDTSNDFENIIKLYSKYNNISSLQETKEMLDFVKTNDELITSMQLEIEKNSK